MKRDCVHIASIIMMMNQGMVNQGMMNQGMMNQVDDEPGG
jgi:hypothetical protein